MCVHTALHSLLSLRTPNTNKIAKTGKSERSEVEWREDMGLYRRLVVGYYKILRSPSPTPRTVHCTVYGNPPYTVQRIVL
jgi:hypothetical protein